MATIINLNLNEIKERRDVWNTITDQKKQMARVNFNFAITCGYALGETIPTYETENGVKVEPTTFAYAYANVTELADEVGMNKGTISKTLKAFKWIVENGHFNDFASGKYIFSFDKIWWLTDREKTFSDNGYNFGDLMMDSLASLKKKYSDLLKKGDNARLTNKTISDKNTNSDNANNDDNEVLPLKDTDTIKIPLEGVEYEVIVGDLRAFLKEKGKVC